MMLGMCVLFFAHPLGTYRLCVSDQLIEVAKLQSTAEVDFAKSMDSSDQVYVAHLTSGQQPERGIVAVCQ